MTCGIYLGAPVSSVTNGVYIGLSINIEDRVRKHNYDMSKGAHVTKVQEAYNLYGIFSWEIIKECKEEELKTFEKYYIKLFNACTEGFNTYEDSSSAPILYGLDHGKVTKDRILLCKSILDITISNPTLCISKIAKLANTQEHTVSHIWYGDTSEWIEELFPIEYEKVLSLSGTRQMGGKSAKQQGKLYPSLLSPDLAEYNIENVRQFAQLNNLDKGDLNNVLNQVVASVKGWIIKDLDIINPALHIKFYSTNRGHYKRQFDLYKGNKHGTTSSYKGRI